VTRSRYHHGDLERALIDAAWVLARDKGADSVRLREVCRQVGVSPASAYHHFPDRETLLRAVAGRALRALGDALARSLASGPQDDPRCRLALLARAYVAWALDEPRLFRLALGPYRDSPGRPADDSPLQVLDAEAAAFAAARGLPPAAGARLAPMLWAAAHGIAALAADGPLQPPGGRDGVLDLADQLTAAVIDGTAFPIPAASAARPCQPPIMTPGQG
jgi:AcrR family transcriptional regulator